jgi:DNA-directed RNA polymerase specialized sigma24 family protein
MRSTATSANEQSLDGLLARIRAGEREAAAEFVRRHEALLRRRYRHKVGTALRRLVDSEDMVSTLSRRLDAYMASGKLQEVTLEQLWSLIYRIVEHALADKGRLARRLQIVEGEDRPFAAALETRLEGSAAEGELGRIIGTIDDPVDREILQMWLAGAQHKVIAANLGISHVAVRKRWQRTKTALREQLEAD